MATEKKRQKNKKTEQYLQYHASLLKSGEAMPSIRELMQLIGVSRPTLEAGLRMLVSQNILEVHDRSGYYRTSYTPGVKESADIIDIVACSVVNYLDLPDGFPQKMIHALLTVGSSLGYGCRVHRVGLDEPLAAYEAIIEKYGIRHAVLYGAHTDEIWKIFSGKCVHWCGAYPRFAPHYGPVLCESEELITIQLEHLFACGHRKIAYIDEFDTSLPSWHFLVRRERYYKFMAEHELKVYPDFCPTIEWERERLFLLLDRMFGNNSPTAVVVPSSILPDFYEYCNLRNLTIGADISLTTFERHVEWPLSPVPAAIQFDIMEGAQKLFELLQLRNPEARRKAILYTDAKLQGGKSIADLTGSKEMP